jgi:hypothetical protein
MNAEKCMIHVVSRRYKKCNNANIALYIMWKGERVPLCMKHWVQIAKSRREWSSDMK